ncbi:MAG: hypothetical protein K0M64_10850 [Rhizobium sp.]|nr:hypothetical protein [Rhizobium sp.]
MSLSSRLASCLALILLVAAAYWTGLTGGFLFDDYPNIVQEKSIHATSLRWEQIRDAATSFGHGSGRAIPLATFAVDYVFWGLDAEGYKRTSLAIHILNSLLILQLLQGLLLMALGPSRGNTMAAFALAALWAVHPLQVSTVLYVVQRMEMLAVTFVLLALLAYLHGRRKQIDGSTAWPWLVAASFLVLLGLACKENAILFPAFALALELTLLRFGAASARTARNWKILYALSAFAGILIAAAFVPYYTSSEIYAIRDYGAYERVLTQARVLPMYLWWILAPLPSQYLFYYDNFAPSVGLLSPWTTAAGLCLLLGLITAALTLRHRMPLFALGLFWFIAAHLVTSSYLPLELAFEHRNYFAILGVLLALYDLIRRYRSKDQRRVALASGTLLVLGVGAICAIRSATWGSPLQLAMDLAERNPTSARASTDLGEQYMILAANDPESPYFAMAEHEFERGSLIPGSGPLPEQGLIVLAASAGLDAKDEWWDRIVQKLESRVIGPQELTMIVGFLDLAAQGLPIDDHRLSEAYAVLARRAIMPASQYYAFGLHALEYADDPALAEVLLRSAVDHSEGDPELVQALANALASGGHQEQAAMLIAYAKSSAGIDVVTPRIVEIVD